MNQLYSKYATVEDVLSSDYVAINRILDEITVQYDLSDHSDLNAERYPWSVGMLNRPAFYAARLWEYPYAILAADLKPGMTVADIGCGMTAFTIYLKDQARCEVMGVDPDIFESGIKYRGHGVSQKFINRTGLTIVRGDMDAVPLEDDSQDRVFSISVMEHVDPETRRRGIQEVARILKPGGRAIITVDMSMWFELNRPLDLVWDSGLTLLEPFSLRWPVRRFGMFSESNLPSDIFGMTLVKEDYQIETQYRNGNGTVTSVPAHKVPTLIPGNRLSERSFWRKAVGRLYREIQHRVS